MNHRIREGRPEDIEGLQLREMDLLELRECSSKSCEEQLRESWEMSEMRWTVLAGDQVACVLGCGGKKGKVGVPWLLGTDLTRKVKRAFMTDLKERLSIMLKEYGFLMNYVHPDNKQSIRWLKWLGFKFKEPEPFGEFGNLFHPFYMVDNV